MRSCCFALPLHWSCACGRLCRHSPVSAPAAATHVSSILAHPSTSAAPLLPVLPPLSLSLSLQVGPYYPEGFKPVRLFADDKHVRAWPGGLGDAKVGGNYAPTIRVQSEAAAKGYSQVRARRAACMRAMRCARGAAAAWAGCVRPCGGLPPRAPSRITPRSPTRAAPVLSLPPSLPLSFPSVRPSAAGALAVRRRQGGHRGRHHELLRLLEEQGHGAAGAGHPAPGRHHPAR